MLLLARYVLPVSSDFIENGAILVQDGKIVAPKKLDVTEQVAQAINAYIKK